MKKNQLKSGGILMAIMFCILSICAVQTVQGAG